jgi:hypothetical protein
MDLYFCTDFSIARTLAMLNLLGIKLKFQTHACNYLLNIYIYRRLYIIDVRKIIINLQNLSVQNYSYLHLFSI